MLPFIIGGGGRGLDPIGGGIGGGGSPMGGGGKPRGGGGRPGGAGGKPSGGGGMLPVGGIGGDLNGLDFCSSIPIDEPRKPSLFESSF